MVPFYSAESTRAADRLANEKNGITPALLMENAGRGAAEFLVGRFGRRSWTIACGSGNNGGDGFVLARHLLIAGFDVTVLLPQERSRFKNEPAAFLKILESSGCRIIETPLLDDETLSRLFRDSGGIVDALLGTGSTGEPRGETRRLLSLIPENGPAKVSLDIPSGIDPSSGEVRGVAFRAQVTLSFLAAKIGLRVMPGAAFAGEVEVIPIGIPATEILPSPDLEGYGFSDASGDWPKTRFDDHKGKKGTVIILGGSSRYRGAPILAARAALRAGAGLVVLLVPECVARAASVSLPEAVVIPASLGNDQVLEKKPALDALEEWVERTDALVAGPGMGRSESTAFLVDWISRSWHKPVLFDADALRFLPAKLENPLSLVTPHEGEAGHMLGKPPAFISAARLASLHELSGRFGTVLLKGPFSLCSDGNRTGVVLESTPALAVPGSGDVLSGVAGTLMARGLPPWRAGMAGAWAHARAARFISRKNGSEVGILSHEIADGILAVSSELSPIEGQETRHDARF